jgi:hypothetical protein
MRRVAVLVFAAIALSVDLVSVVCAQKGVGDQTGVARQSVQPPVVAFSGKLVEIRIGLCEKTTGQSPIGTHLFLETPDGKSLDIHLGPASAVADIVAKLSARASQDLTVKAFRTEKMPENHFVAQSLTFDANTIELRDGNLRPVWAGQMNGVRGSGEPQGGGRGRGAAFDPK